jgi:hypothetical protein
MSACGPYEDIGCAVRQRFSDPVEAPASADIMLAPELVIGVAIVSVVSLAGGCGAGWNPSMLILLPRVFAQPRPKAVMSEPLLLRCTVLTCYSRYDRWNFGSWR